jgi:hypothetical protein
MKVTDHAIVRYCERFLDLDKRKISKGIISKIGPTDGRYPLGNGMIALVKDKTVVTIFKSRGGRKKSKKRLDSADPINLMYAGIDPFEE